MAKLLQMALLLVIVASEAHHYTTNYRRYYRNSGTYHPYRPYATSRLIRVRRPPTKALYYDDFPQFHQTSTTTKAPVVVTEAAPQEPKISATFDFQNEAL